MCSVAKLDDIVNEFWLWKLEDSPEFATTVSVHDKDHALESHSLQVLEKRHRKCAVWLKELDALNGGRDSLPKAKQNTYDLMRDQLKTMVDGYKWKTYCAYNPVNFLENIPVDFISTIGSSMKFNTESDFEKYVARLKAIATLAEEQEALMREAIAAGTTLHAVSLTNALKELDRNATSPPEETNFYKPYLKINEAKELPSSVHNTLVEKAKETISSFVQPSLKKLSSFIKTEYMPETRTEYGVKCLPSGAEYYQECLRWHLSVNMTPQQVFDLGKSEVARIRQGMDEVREEVGFSGDLDAFLKHMRTAKGFYHDTEEALLAEYEQIIHGHIKPLLPKVFNRDPGIDLEVKVMPFAGPGGMYYPPATDLSRPGIFYANLDNPETRPRFSMVVLSLHEASPGHHFQQSFALQEDLPRFRKEMDYRKGYSVPFLFPLYTAYIEGWALYCEYLGIEIGAYRSPYDMLGRYSDEILRACRLVVDPGLHVFDWSRDKAIDYMAKNTCLPLDEIEEEVDRYLTWPGQACAYKVGEIKIRELRKYAESALGDKFDLKGFHDVLLKVGAVPLYMLENVVKEWVDDCK